MNIRLEMGGKIADVSDRDEHKRTELISKGLCTLFIYVLCLVYLLAGLLCKTFQSDQNQKQEGLNLGAECSV